MDDKIIIDLKDNLLENTEIQFLNNNNECIICNDKLNKQDDLVLINNLCKCYNAAKICRECLIKWINKNKQCMICRKSFTCDNINIDRINDNNIITQINTASIVLIDEISPDIRIFLEEEQVSSFIIFKEWCYNRMGKCLLYLTIYTFLTFFFISIKMTIEYEKNNTNSTGSIII
tara:strand:- start:1311 stop:1835 length:525 start_codon:yes stop_codon:yes gene_type:complete